RRRFPSDSTLTQGQIDKLAMKYGLEYVARHPAQTLQRDIAKLFHFWQLERETIAGLWQGYWGKLSLVAVLLVAAWILGAYVVTVLSGVHGAVTRPPRQWTSHAFLLLIITF